MRHFVNRYRQLPLRVRTPLEILAICISLFLVVILWQMGIDGSVPAFVLSIIITLIVIGIEPYQKWQYRRKAKQRYRDRVEKINQQLAGRSQKDILQSSPYEFSRWPDGDDCYVIGDKRTGKIIASVMGISEAELWILEQTLLEEKNPPGPNDSIQAPR